MLAVAAVLTACTNEDNFTNEQLPNSGNEARTFTVNIPASMGEGATTRAVSFNNTSTPPTATGSFNASEQVYVYNETKGVMLSGVLHPSNISAGGKLCNLTGELTGTVDASDQLTLLYNMNRFKANNAADCYFRYDYQDGSESGVIDGGMATGVSATISGSTLTTATTVTFAMQQAIFRLKFTDGTNTISVNKLTIECTGSDVVGYYSPFNEDIKYEKQTINVMPTTPTSDYLYVALGINENASPSELTFTVIDEDGDVYTATKAAPSGGFKNGKYYYSSAATVLTKQTLVKPTITWTSVIGDTPVEPDSYNWYYVTGPEIGEMKWGSSEFTISGISRGYRFIAYNGATIHLDNLVAIHDYSDLDFIYSTNDQYQLILDINGTNSITTKNNNYSIYADGTLKLMGNGTLTVTAKIYDHYGLYADMNYKSGNNSDATVLAAPGYAVTRSATTNNQDGTYTWTYTVTPAINGKFTINSSGDQVYFAKGNLQATYDGSAWTWAFAANQWDYIGNEAANNVINGNGTVSANGTVDLFGWSTSTTYLGIHNSDDDGDYSGDFVDWGSRAGVTAGIGSGWRTLSIAEWHYLFYTRSDAANKYGCATISTTAGDRHGIIILPDAFVDPNKNKGSDAFVGSTTDWDANLYTADNWALMEKNGAVFLPAAGFRDWGTVVDEVGTDGYYWSSSPYVDPDDPSSEYAHYVYFSSDYLEVDDYSTSRYCGHSVRLVRPVQ